MFFGFKLFYIGQAYRRMGDFDKALEYYDKARNHVLKQDIPNATITLPKFHKVDQLQYRQGNLNEAMNTYSRNNGRTSLLDSMNAVQQLFGVDQLKELIYYLGHVKEENDFHSELSHIYDLIGILCHKHQKYDQAIRL